MNTIPPNPKDIPCVAVPKIVVAVLDASPEHDEHTSNIPNLRQGMREPTLVPNILDTDIINRYRHNKVVPVDINAMPVTDGKKLTQAMSRPITRTAVNK